MSSPSWDPQRPPSGPPPRWQHPNPYGPADGHGYPPGPQWPAGGQPPPYGPPPPPPYRGFTAAPPRQRSSSKTRRLLAIVVVAAVAIGLFLVLDGRTRDERSYQAGRSAAQSAGAGALIKFGGMTPEAFCEGRFALSAPLNQKSDIKRRDFMAGCLDAVEEQLNRKP